MVIRQHVGREEEAASAVQEECERSSELAACQGPEEDVQCGGTRTWVSAHFPFISTSGLYFIQYYVMCYHSNVTLASYYIYDYVVMVITNNSTLNGYLIYIFVI